MARIWVHGENEGPMSHPIGDSLIVGRRDHCGLVLDDETVSLDHAEVTRRGASYPLTDLGRPATRREISHRSRVVADRVIALGLDRN